MKRDKSKIDEWLGRIMAIIEAGLVVNGLPIIRSSYHKDIKEVDPIIKMSLVTALKTFANEAFEDQPEALHLKNFSIMLHDISSEETDSLFLYCILEKKTDEGEVRKRLKRIEEKATMLKVIMNQPVATKGLKKIKKIIDKELKDLYLKPADRAKTVFG